MPKLLYSATAADGARCEGFVEADSVAAARAQLEGKGLREVVLQPDADTADDDALHGLSGAEQQELARLRLRLMDSPGLKTLLVEQARRALPWLALDAAVVAWGLWQGDWRWIVAGLVAAALPFAFTAWNFRHADRYHRMLARYAIGDWDAVRVLIRDLRAISRAKPMIDFDLDLRLAAVTAREQGLADGLAAIEPWRARWAKRPGFFEMRAAVVHLMGGDTAGFVRAMATAHEAAPADPARATDHALAEARFGSEAVAEALLQKIDLRQLPPHGHGFVQWARGLVALRRREPQAGALLAQAVGSFLRLAGQPAVWTPLALATADHAVALQQHGRHAEARARIADVWPILRVHATVPLLRMLDADGLLPADAARVPAAVPTNP